MFVLLHVRHVRSVSWSENERFVQHVLIVLSWALLSPRPCPPDASTPGYLSELTSHCVLHLFFFLPLSFFFSSSLSHILLSPCSVCDPLFIFLLLRPLCPPSIPPSSTSIPAIAVLFLPSSSSLPSPFSSSSLHHPPATPLRPTPPSPLAD